MISDIWTLEPHGTPGSAATLSERGVTSAEIAWANQDAGRLTLTIAAEDVGGADVSAYTYKSRWVLRRDGAVFFRGRVRSVPRRSGAGSVTIELVDAWDDMSRTPYLQAWDVVGADGSITQESIPRALLSAPAGRQTTTQCLTQILAAYNAAGSTTLTLLAQLPALTMPPIEAANLSCAALVRAVLQYHPGAVAAIQYGASADVLRVYDRSLAGQVALEVGARPLQDFDLVRRDDLVADAVHVYYSTSATRFATVAGPDPGDPETIRATRRLAVFADKYPASSAATDETMVVELAAPAIAEPPAPPVPQMVAIKTRPIPEDGDDSATAQRWWLDMLGLSVHGITVDDVFLPGSGDDGQPHRVRFAWAVNDPNDPLHQAPSAINPNSTVVWRPDSVSDLPRQLISGTLAEWMRVDAAELAIDATVYLRKSTVDGNAAALKVVQAMSPRVGKLGTVDAYIIDREVRCIGTNAKTRVYKNWAATGSYDPAADTAAAIEAAREEAVVPGLARALYEDRATAPWEGTVPLVAEEAGATRYLGRSLNLIHPSRPEWATMRAMIQTERLDLTRGATTLQVGPPQHLSPQDRAALWQAARMGRAERAQAAVYPASPSADESDDSLDLPGNGGVFPGTVAPIRQVTATGTGEVATRRIWDIEIVDSEAGTIKLSVPGKVRVTDDVDSTGLISIGSIGSTFAMAEGDYLVLEWDATGSSPVCTLKALDTWSGFPYAYTTADSGDHKIFQKGYTPLWVAKAADDVPTPVTGLHVVLNADVTLERLAPDAHFEVINYLVEIPSGQMVDVDRLIPGCGAGGA